MKNSSSTISIIVILTLLLVHSIGWSQDNLCLELQHQKEDPVYLTTGDIVKISVKLPGDNLHKTKYQTFKGELKLTKKGSISVEENVFDITQIEQIKTVKSSSRNWAKKTGWIVLGSAAVVATASGILFARYNNTDVLAFTLAGILAAPLSTVFFKVWNSDREKNIYKAKKGWQFSMIENV